MYMQKTFALIYCRVSSERQKNDGHGLDSQEHRCREYARTKGYEIERVFRDSFSGGGDFMNRPAMRSLLDYADKNRHKKYVVIFDDLKRFARDTIFHWNLRREFRARELKPECLNYNFDDSPEGAFVETIFAAQGQLEREQNKRQVIQKQKARLEKGYWPFYPPPGYVQKKDPIHGKLLVSTEPEATTIREALEKYASGELYEQMDVLRFLVSKNYYGKRKGKKPYVEDVKRLLMRSIYAGYVEYLPWEVSRRKGHHKPLISLETFEKIQKKLLGKVRTQTRKDANPDFPLRGFVLCEHCRKPYTASWSRGRNAKFGYYRCASVSCLMRNKGVPKSVIEGSFGAILRHIKPKPGVLELTKAITLDIWNEKVGEVKKREEKDKNRLKEILGEVDGFMDRVSKSKKETLIQEYEQQIERLSEERKVLEERINGTQQKLSISFETALEKVFEILKNPHTQWEKEDLSEKRLIFKIIFESKLAYDPQNGFGTAELSLPLRVFKQVIDPNVQDVEMAGVEPASNEFFTDTLHA